MELALLPCPFCGKPAERSQPMRITIEETMEAEPYINCSQPRCAGRHVCATVNEWQYRTARIAELEAQLTTMTAERDSESAWAKEYSDEVIKLEAQLAAERERNRWIPVTERMPECTLSVVACQNPFSPFVACYVPGEGTWYDDDGIELDFIPTHWRELPEPSEADHDI